MLLLIDNYDSFTYNLVQYFGELGQKLEVHRNDKITIKQIEDKAPKYLVISPGPCTPNEAGISIQAIKHFAGKIPIFGVCLGFQSIVQAFGGKIIGAKEIMHGKVSPIYHHNIGVFKNLQNPLQATRYHSLVAKQSSLPECFEITAQTQKNGKIDEIMGIKHKTLAIEGVQLNNFLQEYN
jgi:anthranilate synthase component 2